MTLLGYTSTELEIPKSIIYGLTVRVVVLYAEVWFLSTLFVKLIK